MKEQKHEQKKKNENNQMIETTNQRIKTTKN